MNHNEVFDIIENPYLFDLLPPRSRSDLKLCVIWDQAVQGIRSWSFFSFKNHYVLRRLYSEREHGVVARNLSIYGREAIASSPFYQEVRCSLECLGKLKSELMWIDSKSITVTIDGIRTIGLTCAEETQEVLYLQAIFASLERAVEQASADGTSTAGANLSHLSIVPFVKALV